jgi:hypothetical protein
MTDNGNNNNTTNDDVFNETIGAFSNEALPKDLGRPVLTTRTPSSIVGCHRSLGMTLQD